MVNTLKKITNAAWALEYLDTTKLAKYMRCLFQIALSGSSNIAEQLLDQICNLAQDAAEVRPINFFPRISSRLITVNRQIYPTQLKNLNG
jgi:hypothetical protein